MPRRPPCARGGQEDTRRSAAADRHAHTIRDALMEAAPRAMTTAQLLAATELSRWQLKRGLAALRELCGPSNWPPLLWKWGKGYWFCLDEDELEDAEQQWAKTKARQVNRFLMGVLAPHTALFPGSRWATYLDAQITAVKSALDLIANPPG